MHGSVYARPRHQNPEKQNPPRRAGLHPAKPGSSCLWQDRASPTSPNLRKPDSCHGRSVPWQAASGRVAAAPRRQPLFPIVAVPFDAFQALPRPEHRWLLTCLSRYADRAGTVLAVDAPARRRRPACRWRRVCRRLGRAGRARRVSARAQARRALRLPPGRSLPAALAGARGCFSSAKQGVSQAANSRTSRAYQARGGARARRFANQGSASARSPTTEPNGRRGCAAGAIAVLAAAMGSEAGAAGVLRAGGAARIRSVTFRTLRSTWR